LMLATGAIASEAAIAAQQLHKQGTDCGLVIVSTLNPAPMDTLGEWIAQYSAVVTVEAHYRIGGLGSLAAEVIAERGLHCELTRCGVSAMPDGTVGSQHYLQQKCELGIEDLIAAVMRAVGVSSR
jgi:transketolase